MSALVARGPVVRHGADALLPEVPAALARVRTFHTLDALRGVAALAIVLFHAAFFLHLPAPAEGQIAVDLFFVMSGFIIAHRYEAELRAGMGLGAFLRVRLVRLYPLYLLGALLGVVPSALAVAAGATDPFHVGMVASLPFHLLMLPSAFVWPRIEELFPFNYVAWSLALEVAVNILYAASARVWTMRRLAGLVILAFAGLCVCDVVYGSLKYGYAWGAWPVGVARILYGFPMGILLHRLHTRRPFALQVPWWAILAAAAAMVLMPPPVAKPVWELVCVAIVVPLVVVAAVVNEPPRAAEGACALAGILSYVVYSLHAPFISLFIRGEELLHVDLASQTPGKGASFAVGLAALCVLAHLAWDKPVRRWLSRSRMSSRAGLVADILTAKRGRMHARAAKN